jgi:hypothetical protein
LQTFSNQKIVGIQSLPHHRPLPNTIIQGQDWNIILQIEITKKVAEVRYFVSA